jgi:hypothetical protein
VGKGPAVSDGDVVHVPVVVVEVELPVVELLLLLEVESMEGVGSESSLLHAAINGTMRLPSPKRFKNSVLCI